MLRLLLKDHENTQFKLLYDDGMMFYCLFINAIQYSSLPVILITDVTLLIKKKVCTQILFELSWVIDFETKNRY